MMAGLKKFEDILAWQKARKASKRIYEITAGGNFAKDYGLRDQIRRAAVSVAANIAEGSKRPGSADDARFLDIARGSLAESQCLLLLCRDLGFCPVNFADKLVSDAEDISRMLNALRKAVLRRAKAVGGDKGGDNADRRPKARRGDEP